MAIMKDEYKYKNWTFTCNYINDDPTVGVLWTPQKMVDLLDFLAETWQFQLEKGEETSRLHLQGCFNTLIRKRKKTILKEIYNYLDNSALLGKSLKDIDKVYENLTIKQCYGTFEQALAYASKIDTRVSGPWFSSDVAMNYSGSDLYIFNDIEDMYSWQKTIFNLLAITGSKMTTFSREREIIWIVDTQGCSGKSKFVKYLCYRYKDIVSKLSFGTASQLRSAVVTGGPKKLYLIDIPRTLGKDDSIESLISVIEDIKNGFVVSSMYGKHDALMMDPPQVIIFANMYPDKTMMSSDRWSVYQLNFDKTLKINF